MADSNSNGQTGTRPDSTIARNFGEQLDGMFNLGGETEQLSQTIQAKKETISTQSKELEELEAKLRAADEALRRATASGPATSVGAAITNGQRKRDIRDVFPAQGSVADNETVEKDARAGMVAIPPGGIIGRAVGDEPDSSEHTTNATSETQ